METRAYRIRRISIKIGLASEDCDQTACLRGAREFGLLARAKRTRPERHRSTMKRASTAPRASENKAVLLPEMRATATGDLLYASCEKSARATRRVMARGRGRDGSSMCAREMCTRAANTSQHGASRPSLAIFPAVALSPSPSPFP